MLTAGPRAHLDFSARIARSSRATLHRRLRHLGRPQLRAGFVAEDASGLPSARGLHRAIGGSLFRDGRRVVPGPPGGPDGGVLEEIVDRRLGDPFFGIFLNPGHQLHLDEWVNTPVGPGRP